jgi:hypothetical protein
MNAKFLQISKVDRSNGSTSDNSYADMESFKTAYIKSSTKHEYN